jgi:hypothetical protein
MHWFAHLCILTSFKTQVLLLHVTDGYIDFLDNFMAHYSKIDHSRPHVVKVVVASRAAEVYVRERYGFVEVALGKKFGCQAFGFNDKGFTEIVVQRPALIRQELMADRNGET